MAGIYLHVPFCKQACHYCDFHFSTNLAHRADLVAAMAKELALRSDYLEGEQIATIYFGGGTPSLLNNQELEMLLEAIRRLHIVDTNAEVTLEANPDDLTPETLRKLAGLGINRLSIGIQSFDDNVLKFLNRAHDATSALNCVASARAAGFSNISIDLIYAIPGQPISRWKDNIDTAVKLEVEHISSYSLTIEEKTAFGKWSKTGKLKATPDDEAAAQLELLVARLSASGYVQYEVSNFAQPGYESRHNTSYWQGKKYLGIGPSAHSYDLESRQYNIANNHLYLKSINQGVVPFTKENLSQEDHVNEYLLTTLRTVWGADLGLIQTRWGIDVTAMNAAYIDVLINQGLGLMIDNRLVLTTKGKLLADKIASDLFL
jgi:oxygen-independent coproporphyrinogen III oxidase